MWHFFGLPLGSRGRFTYTSQRGLGWAIWSIHVFSYVLFFHVFMTRRFCFLLWFLDNKHASAFVFVFVSFLISQAMYFAHSLCHHKSLRKFVHAFLLSFTNFFLQSVQWYIWWGAFHNHPSRFCESGTWATSGIDGSIRFQHQQYTNFPSTSLGYSQTLLRRSVSSLKWAAVSTFQISFPYPSLILYFVSPHFILFFDWQESVLLE